MRLHPHPDHNHVYRVYRAYLLDVKRKWKSTRCLIHCRELWAIYLEAKQLKEGLKFMTDQDWEHPHTFEQALELWRHPFWAAYATDDLDSYCAFVREQTDLRLGIEADFVFGASVGAVNGAASPPSS